MKLTSIQRNDLDACTAYHDERGGVTPDEAEQLIMLQDDPRALKRLMYGWTIKPRTTPAMSEANRARWAERLARHRRA